mgnify:CR=1 FL=1
MILEHAILNVKPAQGAAFEAAIGVRLPADVRAKLVDIAKKAHSLAEVQNPMKERGITPIWEGSEQSRTEASKFADMAGVLLKELGLAK